MIININNHDNVLTLILNSYFTSIKQEENKKSSKKKEEIYIHRKFHTDQNFFFYLYFVLNFIYHFIYLFL